MALSFLTLIQPAAQAATRIKQNNTHNLNLATSWDVTPGAADIALWNSTVTGANNVQLGADLSWLGLKVASPGGTVTLEAGHTLTLGTVGIDMSTAMQNLTINCGLTLRGKQGWKANFNRLITINIVGSFNTTGAVVDFSAFPTNGSLGTIANDASGILGPWATWGSGTSLYYVKCTPMVSPFITATAGTAGTLANVTSPTVNYTFAAAATLTGNITANTLRFTGGNVTLANAGKSITLNGLLNAGSGTSGALTLSGAGKVVIGSNRELVIVSNTRNTSFSSPIADNPAGASCLTYSGGGSLSLFAANTYSGGTTVNAGTLVVNNGSTLGLGDVTVNEGTLSLSAGTSGVIGDTNTLTIADGAAHISLAAGVNETVLDLYLGSTRAARGTWGSSDSAAEHIDDAHFLGAGLLTVLYKEDAASRLPRFAGALDFGEVATNATSTRSVEIWNDGNQPLSVTNVWVPAGFSVTQQVFVVPAGGSVTLSVVFAPSELTPYAGLLTLECDATSGSVSLAVSGTGVAPVPPVGMRTIEALSAVIAIDVPEDATSLGVEDELAPGLTPVSISDGGTWDAANRKVKWFFNESGQVRDRALQYTVNCAGNVITGSVNFGAGNRPIIGDTVFEGGAGPGLLHPADDNGDWRIVLQEVSASVTRWKSGLDDVKSPIVIRGITLYLQGELYYYNPQISAEAKRWVSQNTPASPAPDIAYAKSAMSHATTLAAPQAGAVRAAATTNVTITVTPESGTTAWGLDESLPLGVQVAGISDSGTWDATHRRIKWAFFDGTARALSYTLEGQAGTNVSVTGSVSFDGSDDAVTGTSVVTVPLPFSTWCARRGLSGDANTVFRSMNVEHGQPNGLVYAFQSSLQSGDLFLEMRWENGKLFIETPRQDPSTLSLVDICVEGKTNLTDTLWPILLVPAEDQSAVPGNRYRWTPSSLPDRAFYHLKAILK